MSSNLYDLPDPLPSEELFTDLTIPRRRREDRTHRVQRAVAWEA